MSSGSAREHALEIAERIETFGPISVARFFGGAGLIAQDVIFGFVIRGSLYLRVDDESRPAYEAAGAAPFSYARPTRTVTVASFFEAPVDIMEEDDELGRWAAEALRAALAAAQKKAVKKRKVVVEGAPARGLTKNKQARKNKPALKNERAAKSVAKTKPVASRKRAAKTSRRKPAR